MTQIMVVEDEPILLEVIEEILHSEGFAVVSAPNGRAMLQLLATVRPALILLDVMMPEMTGPEALAVLRQHPRLKDIPVVMMSAGLMAPGIDKEVVGFLAKPFEIDQVLALIRKIIENAEWRSPPGEPRKTV